MRRIALVVIAILAGMSAFADDQILLLRIGEKPSLILVRPASSLFYRPWMDCHPKIAPKGRFGSMRSELVRSLMNAAVMRSSRLSSRMHRGFGLFLRGRNLSTMTTQDRE